MDVTNLAEHVFPLPVVGEEGRALPGSVQGYESNGAYPMPSGQARKAGTRKRRCIPKDTPKARW